MHWHFYMYTGQERMVCMVQVDMHNPKTSITHRVHAQSSDPTGV